MQISGTLQPKQGFFDYLMENSRASLLGYGGSRGGAKSGAARRIQVKRRLMYPRTNGLIMRRVWDDVEKNHVNPMWEDFPALYDMYKGGSHCIEFPNGSRLFFDSAENSTDVQRKAFGPEFMDIFVDQAEQFTEKELKQIKTTCRWPGMPDHKCKMGLFFNPGGIGAGYLQRIFYTKEYHEREVAHDHAFIQAYGWDNYVWAISALREDYPDLTDDQRIAKFYSWNDTRRFNFFITRTQYGQELNRLDSNERPGQLLGDFKKFAGQYFSNWDEAVHVWDIENIVFEPWWTRWISIDWGFQHHTSVHWHCQAGTVDEKGKHKPLVVTYREMIARKMSERALAEEIVANNDGDKIAHIYAGHDIWKKESNGSTKEKAMSSVFRAHGLPTIKQAVINRVEGWRFMHRSLDEGEWIITRNCKEAISAIPTRVYNEKEGKEDILKTNDLPDDVCDELRYGLYSQAKPDIIPDEVQFQENVKHLSDPTSRAIMLMRLNAERDRKIGESGAVNSRSLARYKRYAKRYGRIGRIR